ncbi:MAG: bifunctional 4-hydroxy-2-oxoglutarate aldolase/2-dehydro-3-deoxy-phosphogluconate aldolase [Tropicimonas sp.]|uniref:bifunctional 4-hydroxy-2-oxoglutarate aldolase/2-dehydro-3-deoxy-phosphogluconate aldolase n=1 Tax=Tropicimonas sp. TaxID=2067044 RepID=UPI003A842C70
MEVFDRIGALRVVPVIAIDRAEDALPLADALAQGGLPVAEITFRTEACIPAIEAISRHRPDIFVGAGTVIHEAQIAAAREAGASFALAPGFSATLVQAAAARGLPYVPGVMTPSDIQAALACGCRFLKFFPAGAAGGPDMLKSIAAPFLHEGISFNPTGGISPANMADWLALPHVRAVGGTWIATRADIATGNWDRIAENARQAVALTKAAGGDRNV